MAEVDGTILTKDFIDPSTDNPVVLQTVKDSVSLEHRLKVEATGVTFDGTLDPTNLALEAGNLVKLVSIKDALAPTLGTVQKVATSSVAALTGSAVGSTLILLVATLACHIAIADAPTATSSSFYLPANTPMVFSCQTTNKVSVIRDAADGSLYVTAIN